MEDTIFENQPENEEEELEFFEDDADNEEEISEWEFN